MCGLAVSRRFHSDARASWSLASTQATTSWSVEGTTARCMHLSNRLSPMRTSVACAALLIITFVPESASAQRLGLSVDATLGAGSSKTNGQYTARSTNGAAFDVMVGVRNGPMDGGGFLVAANWWDQSAGAQSDVCLPKVGGGCLDDFPSPSLFGVMAGWQTENGVVRFAAGPAYGQLDDDSALGFQGRADLSAPVFRWVGLVVSLRGAVLPNVAGNRFELFAAGVGVRLVIPSGAPKGAKSRNGHHPDRDPRPLSGRRRFLDAGASRLRSE